MSFAACFASVPLKPHAIRVSVTGRVTDAETLKSAASDRAAAEAALRALPPQRVAYVGAVHIGTGTFTGTGPAGRPRPIAILPRGDVTKPGRPAGPGAIASVPGLNGRFALPPDAPEGERRAFVDAMIAAIWPDADSRAIARAHFQGQDSRTLSVWGIDTALSVVGGNAGVKPAMSVNFEP